MGLVPLGVVTVTSTVPAFCCGGTAWMEWFEATVKLPAATLPNVT